MGREDRSEGRGVRVAGWIVLAWGFAGVIYSLSPASPTGTGAYAAGAKAAVWVLGALAVIGLWQLLRTGGLTLVGVMFVAIAAGAAYYSGWVRKASGRRPTRAACEQTIDHVIQLVGSDPGLPPRALPVYRQHRAEMIKRCVHGSREQMDCAASAQSFAAFKRCP